jgi:RNA polymerase sigma-70 factor (ECF subfamily)
MKEKLKKIDRLLQKLPVKQREIFILRNYDELSYEEISEVTGKSIGGLKANYFHAINKIMELVKENEN